MSDDPVGPPETQPPSTPPAPEPATASPSKARARLGAAKVRPLFGLPAQTAWPGISDARIMVKRSWSRLTDADLAKAAGSLDQLYAAIRSKVGGARGETGGKGERSDT